MIRALDSYDIEPSQQFRVVAVRVEKAKVKS